MDYGEWKKKRASVVDPTLVCGGLGSTRINGKHPTGLLYCDDIHDLNNSTSQTERATVVKQMTSVVLKTVIREDDKLKTWVFVVGVPWAKDDTYQLLMDSGQYNYEVLPVMRPGTEEEGAVYIDGLNKEKGVTYEDIQGWWVLTWPEKFGVNSIMFERSLGKFEFWQMMMMDIETAGAGSLKYYTYPAGEVDYAWFVQPGVDPTNVDKPPQEYARRSKFAISYIGERPMGGGVLIDGVLESCGLAQAINHMQAGQTRFPNCKPYSVENTGGGAMFIQGVRLNSSVVRVVESGLRGMTDKVVSDKKTRFLNNVAPYFEDGTILVSDANTPFLNAFRSLMDNFYDLDPKHSEEFDVADSVFHALRNMTGILALHRRQEQAAYPVRLERQKHPLSGIRDYVGYGQSYSK